MSEIHQTQIELEKQLQDQINLLKELAKLYDAGKTFSAKPMATVVRILVHDTPQSTSLLTQLNRKTINFFDTIGAEESSWGGGKRVGSYHGLVGAATNSTYTPYLDDPPPGYATSVPFAEYWQRIIFTDGKGNSFTRRDIILALANKDGGAHVDPDLNTKYAELSRQNSLGLNAGMDGDLKPLQGAELAAARQIAHEMLRTLEPSYPNQKLKTGGAMASVGGIKLFAKDSIPTFLTSKATTFVGKVGRNEQCPCGSGKKYKKCHGK